MKEIKLWKVSQADKGRPTVQGYAVIDQIETAEMLEGVFIESPDLLFPGLQLIGRQTGTGVPDGLLGVDGVGRLVVIELNRGVITQEAVLRLIDYASFLASLSPNELAAHVYGKSGGAGIKKTGDFTAWYQEQFGRKNVEIQMPRLFLVGLGVNERAERIVSFLSKGEIDISLITFHGFQDDDRIILARQVDSKPVEVKPVESKPVEVEQVVANEVESKPVETKQLKAKQIAATNTKAQQGKNTREDDLKQLKSKIRTVQVSSFFLKLAWFFKENLVPAGQWIHPTEYALYFPEILTTGSQVNTTYVSLYLYDNKPGKILLYFHASAVKAAGEHWAEIMENEKVVIKTMRDGSAGIWVGSERECDAICLHFIEICPYIIQGWYNEHKKRPAGFETESQDAPVQKKDADCVIVQDDVDLTTHELQVVEKGSEKIEE